MTLILRAVKCDTMWLQKDTVDLKLIVWLQCHWIKLKDNVNPEIITFVGLLIETYKHEIGKKSNG